MLAIQMPAGIEVTTPEYPLGQADEALTDLSEGRIAGAAVLLV